MHYKDVYVTFVFYSRKSGKFSRNCKKHSQSERLRGSDYIMISFSALALEHDCILSNGVGKLVAYPYSIGLPEPREWDKQKFIIPRLFYT